MTTDPNKAQSQAGGNAPGPDVMLGLWASWMDQMSAPAQASGGAGGKQQKKTKHEEQWGGFHGGMGGVC